MTPPTTVRRTSSTRRLFTAAAVGLLLSLVPLTGAAAHSAHSVLQPTNVVGSWHLQFDDEFAAGTLDLSKWQPNWYGSSPSAITQPVNSSESACYDPAHVSEGNGELDLSVAANPCLAANGVTYPYRSGLIESNGKFNFTYGVAEARIWTPAGTGMWPAFWSDGQTWPNDGEIDHAGSLRHGHHLLPLSLPRGRSWGQRPGPRRDGGLAHLRHGLGAGVDYLVLRRASGLAADHGQPDPGPEHLLLAPVPHPQPRPGRRARGKLGHDAGRLRPGLAALSVSASYQSTGKAPFTTEGRLSFGRRPTTPARHNSTTSPSPKQQATRVGTAPNGRHERQSAKGRTAFLLVARFLPNTSFCRTHIGCDRSGRAGRRC